MDNLLYFGLAILCCVYAVAKYNSSKAGKGTMAHDMTLLRGHASSSYSSLIFLPLVHLDL